MEEVDRLVKGVKQLRELAVADAEMDNSIYVESISRMVDIPYNEKRRIRERITVLREQVYEEMGLPEEKTKA